MKQLITLLITIFIYSFNTNVPLNNTSIEGRVTELNTGEPVLYGTVALYKNGVLITGTDTDFEGNYFIGNLDPGTYDIKAKYLGCKDSYVTGYEVKYGQRNVLNFVLESGGVTLDEISVIAYKLPLIDVENTSTGTTITSEKISKLGVSNINGVKKENVNLRGTRSKETIYFMDGIRIKGSKSKENHSINDNHRIEYNSESYDELVENQFYDPTLDPLSTFAIDVDRAAYSNVRRFINASQKPPANAVRIEEMINFFEYNYQQPSRNEPLVIHTTYTDCPWNENNKILHLGLQAKNINVENLPPSNIVFLIDVSGSMSNANKLPLVQASMKLLVRQMRPQDLISIVTYAGRAGIVLKPTSGDNKDLIIAKIESLSSGGSTAGAEGIITAYNLAEKTYLKNGNNRVVLATDGDFNVGISDNSSLEKLIEEKRNTGIFLSVLGYGMGNYQDDKMQLLADKGNGNHAYIDNIQEANKVLVKEFGSTMYTLAKDVKLQIEFNPNHVSSYKLIGYENRLLNKEDFNDDTKDGGEMGVGHTVTAMYEIVPTNSEEITSNVNDLKYQSFVKNVKYSDELATVKFRYKDPKDSKSKMVEKVISTSIKDLKNVSDNVRFSLAVTQFGQVLRSNADINTYDRIIALAVSASTNDKDGYRLEFIKLVESAKLLFGMNSQVENE